MESRFIEQKMARCIVIGILMVFSIGQSDADCMGPFMSCPPMPSVNPFSNGTTFTAICPNITSIFNCYNGYMMNCTATEQMFDTYQQVSGMMRGLNALCTSMSAAYTNNIVCIANFFNRAIASPPPTPTTTGPCSGVNIPFIGQGAANMTGAALCAAWTQFLQCVSTAVVTPCGTAAGQLLADYYGQNYWYYTNKFGCASYTVTGSGGSGGSGSTTAKTNSAQGLLVENFVVMATIVCSALLGWRQLQA